MSHPQQNHVSKRSWLIPVGFAWASLFTLGIIDNSRGPMFPDLLREFAVTDTLGSLFFLLSSMASVIHNLLFRRFLADTAPLRLLGLYTLIMAGGALILTAANTFLLLLVGAFVLGVGFGGVGVGQNAAVQAAPAKYRGRSMGLLHSMYGISSFLAPLGVAAMQPYGWRSALFLGAMPAVIVGLLIVLRPGIEVFRSRRRRSEDGPTAQLVDQTRGPDELPMNSVNQALSLSAQVDASRWAAILIGFLVVAEISISSRLALLARREWGLTAESANSWLAAYFAAMTMARFSLGFLPSFLPTAKILKWSGYLCLPLLLIAFGSLLLPEGAQLSSQVRLFALVGFAFPIALGYPLAMTRIAEVFGKASQGVTGTCLLYQAIAAMLMHMLLGAGADAIGLEVTLASVALISAAGAVISLAKMERAAYPKAANS